MATIINGAKIEQAGYEFGVSDGENVALCDDYTAAKKAAKGNLTLVMRCLYATEWMPAK